MPSNQVLTLIPVLVAGIQQRRVRGARDHFFTRRTSRDWIPVTGTGMRSERCPLGQGVTDER
ncbi:hypothetical protein C6558_33470 [Ensifer sp. NM-2]|nr:hypothetical protein C6558_33470 [Ensifer sp. NM-2]